MCGKRWGLVFSIFFTAHLFAAPPADKAPGKPYNVLFIAIDDLNDWVGARAATNLK